MVDLDLVHSAVAFRESVIITGSHLLAHDFPITPFFVVCLFVRLEIVGSGKVSTTARDGAGKRFFLSVTSFVSLDVFQSLEALATVWADMSLVHTTHDQGKRVFVRIIHLVVGHLCLQIDHGIQMTRTRLGEGRGERGLRVRALHGHWRAADRVT